MIWADRVAIVLAVLLSPVMIWGVDGFSQLAIAVAVAVWVVLRGLDFIGTGRVRRNRLS